MNIMVYAKNIKDVALAMYNEKPGKVISNGKKESYVRFFINNKVYIEFIPNINLKPFGGLSV